ncbi:MAG: hypothetical protein KBT06_00630 [Prevotellaceae bacterium]|nr:hypothetical protein [Candidatus Colivivens equi]
MTKEEVLNYVMTTPNNSNPNVLMPMLGSLVDSSEIPPEVANAIETGGMGWTDEVYEEYTEVFTTSEDSHGRYSVFVNSIGNFAKGFFKVLPNEEFTVIADGEAYNFVKMPSQGGPMTFGNPKWSGGNDDGSGVPFYFRDYRNYEGGIQFYADSEGDHELTLRINKSTVHQIDEKYLPGKEFIIEAHYDPDLEEYVLDTDPSDIIANIDLNTKLSIDDGEMVFPITYLGKDGTNTGTVVFGMAEVIDSLDGNGSFIRTTTPGAKIEWSPKPLPYGGGSGYGGGGGGSSEEADLIAFIRVFDQYVAHHLNIVFEHDIDPVDSGALISPLGVEDIEYYINHGAIFTAGEMLYNGQLCSLGTCVMFKDDVGNETVGFIIRGIENNKILCKVWFDSLNECWREYIDPQPYMPQY